MGDSVCKDICVKWCVCVVHINRSTYSTFDFGTVAYYATGREGGEGGVLFGMTAWIAIPC